MDYYPENYLLKYAMNYPRCMLHCHTVKLCAQIICSSLTDSKASIQPMIEQKTQTSNRSLQVLNTLNAIYC